MKELQTHNLPEISCLFFSSTYNKGFKDFMRIVTQLFTLSKKEHCAGLIQCPMELDGQTIAGNLQTPPGQAAIDKPAFSGFGAGGRAAFSEDGKHGRAIISFT